MDIRLSEFEQNLFDKHDFTKAEELIKQGLMLMALIILVCVFWQELYSTKILMP